jgi:hypothetical protein
MNIDTNTAALQFYSINYFIRFNIYKFHFTFFSQTVDFFLCKILMPERC